MLGALRGKAISTIVLITRDRLFRLDFYQEKRLELPGDNPEYINSECKYMFLSINWGRQGLNQMIYPVAMGIQIFSDVHNQMLICNLLFSQSGVQNKSLHVLVVLSIALWILTFHLVSFPAVTHSASFRTNITLKHSRYDLSRLCHQWLQILSYQICTGPWDMQSFKRISYDLYDFTAKLFLIFGTFVYRCLSCRMPTGWIETICL